MSKVALSLKWWKSRNQQNLRFPALEKALSQIEKNGVTASDHEGLADAIRRTQRELDKKTQRDLIEDLQTLAELSRQAAARVSPSGNASEPHEGDADDEDPSDDKLLRPEVLAKAVKKLARSPGIFAIAIGANADKNKFAVKARGSPNHLLKIVKEAAGSGRGTCGIATADPANPKVLVLKVETGGPGGLGKAVLRILKSTGLTIFNKVRLQAGDEVLEEAEGEPNAPGAGSGAPREAKNPTASGEAHRRGMQEALDAWLKTQDQIDADLEKLKAAVRKAYAGATPERMAFVGSTISKLDTILDKLDDRLAKALSACREDGSPGGKSAVKTVLKEYLQYIVAEPMITIADQNPFGVNPNLRARLKAALTKVNKAVS